MTCGPLQRAKAPIYSFKDPRCEIMIALHFFNKSLQVVSKVSVQMTQSMNPDVHKSNAD